jgi:hypothetical protein
MFSDLLFPEVYRKENLCTIYPERGTGSLRYGTTIDRHTIDRCLTYYDICDKMSCLYGEAFPVFYSVWNTVEDEAYGKCVIKLKGLND